MNLNAGLKRSIGMPFTFKQRLQEFLIENSTSPAIQVNLTPDQQTAVAKYVNNFILCTPAMGYSSKLYAYQAFEIMADGILSGDSNASPESKALVSRLVLNVLRYVGLEGEGDYNFQFAIIKLADAISTITGEVVEGDLGAKGGVVKLRVISGGVGYSDDGDTDGNTPVAFTSSEVDDSVDGTVTVVLVDGVVTEQEYTATTGGSGFSVGQIVLLVDDGGETLTYDIVALAEVTQIA